MAFQWLFIVGRLFWMTFFNWMPFHGLRSEHLLRSTGMNGWLAGWMIVIVWWVAWSSRYAIRCKRLITFNWNDCNHCDDVCNLHCETHWMMNRSKSQRFGSFIYKFTHISELIESDKGPLLTFLCLFLFLSLSLAHTRPARLSVDVCFDTLSTGGATTADSWLFFSQLAAVSLRAVVAAVVHVFIHSKL